MTPSLNDPFAPSAAEVDALAQAVGDDLPASTATTGVIVPNAAAIHGLLEDFFDVDWFRIELQAGVSYHFDLRGGGSDGSKNGGQDVTDTVLRLRNAAGEEILSNDDIPGSKNTRSAIDYTASVGGTYYLEARVDSGPHGHYLLSATATPPVDDYPDNNNLALMVNGPSILGAIETVGDTDRFRVVLTGGTAYDFYLEPRWPNGLGEPRLTLRAADGTPVGTPYSSGRLGFTPPADGVYYLTAAGSGSTIGSYSLRSITAQDDFPAAISTSGSVTVGWEVSGGQLERAGDADYFRVQLEAGKSYAFDLRGNGTKNGPTDTFLRLRAADGSLLASDDDGGNRGSPNGAARILYTAPSSGAYYLEASSDVGQTGRYELRAYADDCSDTNATSGTLATNGTAVSGRIDYADDADRFAVALDAGVLYDFSLGDPAWAALGLLSGDGRSVGMWSAQPRHLIAQPDQSGIYYLRVVGEGTPGASYEVSARPVAGDILASVATTATLNAQGAPVSGVFELPGDRDYYRTELQADKTYFFDLRSHTGSDTHLTLRDASGRLLREDDDSGGSKQARLAFTPTQTGTYYLDARNDSGVSDSGYTLSTVVDDYPAHTGTAGAVTVDGSASAGNLEFSGDADYFRVQLAARTTYAFDLRGDGSKSALGDAHLRLVGTDGSLLASNDDVSYPGGPSRIVFTTTTGGTYYLEASSDTGAYGQYLLSADALPSLTTLAPADNATNVSRSANLVLGYSEAVRAGSGLLTLHGSDGRVLRTVDIQDPSQVRIDGRQLTIDLQDDLAAGTSYYVNLTEGALLDAAGKPVPAITGTSAFNFRTLSGNRAPTAANQAASTNEDTALNGRLPAAADADADSVRYALLQAPLHGQVTVEADGRFQYLPAADYNGADSFRFKITDSQGGSASYTVSLSVAPLRDEVVGGAGIDTFVVQGSRAGYVLQRQGDWWLVGTRADDDALAHFERLQFNDRSVALDLDGHAGTVARLIGALFGKEHLADAALVGRYLARVDAGTTGEALTQLALADPLYLSGAGARSNAAFVTHVFENVFGRLPSTDEAATFVNALDRGEYTQPQLGWIAVGTDLVAQAIDLVGLSTSGLDFLKPAG